MANGKKKEGYQGIKRIDDQVRAAIEGRETSRTKGKSPRQKQIDDQIENILGGLGGGKNR